MGRGVLPVGAGIWVEWELVAGWVVVVVIVLEVWVGSGGCIVSVGGGGVWSGGIWVLGLWWFLEVWWEYKWCGRATCEGCGYCG